MRCINMKVTDILLFLTNLITISSLVTLREQTSPVVLHNEEALVNKHDKDCPSLMKIIRDNNITSRSTNCKNVAAGREKINEEIVLQYAWCVAKNVLIYMCENKLNATYEYLNSNADNLTTICPFNLNFIAHLGDVKFNNSKIEEGLTDKELCSKVCGDLYETKKQCVVLNKVSKFLESYQQLNKNESKVEETLSAEPKETFSTQKSEKINLVSVEKQNKEGFGNLGKSEITSKAEVTGEKEGMYVTEEKYNATKQVEKAIPKLEADPTPEEDEKSTDHTESNKADPKFSISENNDVINVDQDFVSDEDIQPPLKETMDQIPDLQRVEDENKISSAHSEIYSGEGFFQAEESHFFFYFLMFSSVIVIGYIAFHNKNKILAYALEGSSGRRSRRRPNPARYRKLESNLEEAISSNASNAASSSVVY